MDIGQNAINCIGISITGSYGLRAFNAQNCYGGNGSGYGLRAVVAQNCTGVTTSGDYGLYAYRIGIGCYGYDYGSGIGIHGYLLNSCYGHSDSGIPVSSSYKYNMP